MTLEQKILLVLADGNEAVADGLALGIFGRAAQELVTGEHGVADEDYASPPWVSVH